MPQSCMATGVCLIWWAVVALWVTFFHIVVVYCMDIITTVLPAKKDSDVMFCLQNYKELKIDRSLVYLSYPQDRIDTQAIY